MSKLNMHSPDLTAANVAKIASLFPNCVTESRDDTGTLHTSVDFDLLRQELNGEIVEGPVERYTLNWPGKRESIVAANSPVYKTLRPCVEESVNFDTTQNLYIEGDNLEVLKLLQETYLGKVKMIYIDPPYNTGNDFIYDDDFAEDVETDLIKSSQKDESGGRLVANTESNGRFHSDWLTMMYPRLKIARDMLCEDGLIFISIDDNEMQNLKKMCDEIFGESCHIATFVWKNKYGPGAFTRGVASLHEYILLYGRTFPDRIDNSLSEEDQKKYTLVDERFDTRGGYITQPLATLSKDDRPNLVYPLCHNGVEIWPNKQWIWSKERLYAAYKNNEIVINQKAGKYSVRFKQYLRDEQGNIRKGTPLSLITSVFNQDGTKEMEELIGREVFDFPKPHVLIKQLLAFSINGDANKEALVLDFFSGSSSTAHAVMHLNAEDGGNRRFIMVQLPESCDSKSEAFKAGYKNICEIGKERIRRAGKKIKEENATNAPNLDVGFRVFKVDSSNMKDVYYTPDTLEQDQLDLFADAIKEDRTAEDLLFQVFLECGLDLSLPVAKETVEGHVVYTVDGNAMVACFTSDVSEPLIRALAKRQPLKAVFLDRSFGKDSTKLNVTQIFKQLSPNTNVKTL